MLHRRGATLCARSAVASWNIDPPPALIKPRSSPAGAGSGRELGIAPAFRLPPGHHREDALPRDEHRVERHPLGERRVEQDPVAGMESESEGHVDPAQARKDHRHSEGHLKSDHGVLGQHDQVVML